jgi:hypothetical protein
MSTRSNAASPRDTPSGSNGGACSNLARWQRKTTRPPAAATL